MTSLTVSHTLDWSTADTVFYHQEASDFAWLITVEQVIESEGIHSGGFINRKLYIPTIIEEGHCLPSMGTNLPVLY